MAEERRRGVSLRARFAIASAAMLTPLLVVVIAVTVAFADTPEAQDGALRVALVVAVGALLASLAAVLIAGRWVLRSLGELTRAARRLAAGRVDIELGEQPGELGAVADALHRLASELAEARDALDERAVRDALTGLYGQSEFRRHLAAELDRARRYGRELGVAKIEVDGLVEIGAEHGTQAHDDLVRALASSVLGAVRPSDVVARTGTGELTVLLPDAGPAAAATVAERIRAHAAAVSVAATEDRLAATVSIGIAAYPGTSTALEQLLAAADAARHEAQHQGGNRVCLFGG